MLMETAVGLAALTITAGAAMVVFLSLTRETLSTRAHAIAVHEIRNAIERLKVEADSIPEVGESRAVKLSPAIAERYPNLQIALHGEPTAEGDGLRRVRIVATEEREGMRPRETSVEVLVAAGRGREGAS